MKKRHGVLAFLCVVSMITFLDRLALAVAEPGIRSDLHLTPERWGWILSAYILANALFEIPSGAFGDRKGQRLELTRIAGWWSFFTAMTAACVAAWQMAACRFLFGMGAAGAYPNAAGVIARWFPKREHGRAQGFVWGASRLGGALAPLLLVPMQRAFGWRSVFVALGAVGMVWAVAWWRWFRTDPAQMPGISQEELQQIRPSGSARDHASTPWSSLLRLRHLRLITLAYFAYAWGSWFFFGWFTTWLVRGAGFSQGQMGVYASFPFLMGLLGNLAGGVLSERLVIRFGQRRAYRWITSLCLAVASGLLLAMSLTRHHAAIAILATLGFGVMDLMLPSAWAMCMGLGGRFGGTATGIMNTAGNLGGWVCTVVFGYAVSATGNYNLPLQGIAVMVLLAAFLFAAVDCTQGLPPETA